jgi:membrane associated rhomboid family serine protease
MVALASVRPALDQLPNGQVVAEPNMSQGWITDWFILDAAKVMDGQIWRLLTYAFLHSPDPYFMHLLFNMIFLWWFGSDVEQVYGRKEFLAIYLTSAVLGGIAYVAWRLAMGSNFACLGASGAVSTMLILCALHFPRRILYIFFLPMPIWLFALLNIAKDSYLMLHEWRGGASSGVAVQVHIAGAAFAVAYYHWNGTITGLLGGLMWWRHRRLTRSRLKLFEPEDDEHEPVAVSAKTSPQQVAADEYLEAKLDAVLEKIAKKGKDSLTEQEQNILVKAAEMYKRRRT